MPSLRATLLTLTFPIAGRWEHAQLRPGLKILLNPLDQEAVTIRTGESTYKSDATYDHGLRHSFFSFPLGLHHTQFPTCDAQNVLFQSRGTFRFLFMICWWDFKYADSQLWVRVHLVCLSLNGQVSYILRTRIPPPHINTCVNTINNLSNKTYNHQHTL